MGNVNGATTYSHLDYPPIRSVPEWVYADLKAHIFDPGRPPTPDSITGHEDCDPEHCLGAQKVIQDRLERELRRERDRLHNNYPSTPGSPGYPSIAMSSRPHKVTMAELKLRRLTEHNTRLREDLARPRMKISDASKTLLDYATTTRDPLIQSVWGPPEKGKDPYAPVQAEGGCCSLM